MNRSLLVILTAAFFLPLMGCEKTSPAAQCMESFKMDLKDPDSGKVLVWDKGELTYSATNSYGARTQHKALCTEDIISKKWARDRSKENVLIMNKSAERMGAITLCIRNEKKSAAQCAEPYHSTAHSGPEVNVQRSLDEMRLELGF